MVQKCTSCTQVHEHELPQSHIGDNRDSRKKVFVKDSRSKRKKFRLYFNDAITQN